MQIAGKLETNLPFCLEVVGEPRSARSYGVCLRKVYGY